MADSEEMKANFEETPVPRQSPTSEGSAVEDLKTACDGLTNIAAEEMARRERALNLSIKIQAGLLVFVLLYLGYIYAQVSAFDADTATLIVRSRMESELPSATQEAIGKMKAAAPEVVAQWTKDLNDSLPRMRTRLEADLLTHTGELTRHLEADLSKVAVDMVAEAKAEVDKMDPKQSSRERREKIASELRNHFQAESRAAVDRVAAEFSRGTRKLVAQIRRLQAGKNLSAKEKYQRQLLAVWSKLISRKAKHVNKTVEDGLNLTEDVHLEVDLQQSPTPEATEPK